MIALLLTSISSIILQNCLHNYVTKQKLRSGSAILSFNGLIYLVCVLIFGILLLRASLSLYTAVLGVLFGIVTSLANTYKLLALTKGPMHLTLLFTTSSMIIPAMSGVFFGEGFSIAKLLIVLLLLLFLYLSFERKPSAKTGGTWLLFSLLAFLFQGAIGILQKIHQSSVYKAETSGFLFVAFICAMLFCLLKNKGKPDPAIFHKNVLVIGLLCGGCTFAMNFINLRLSGVLPSQLFFPLINGSSIIVSSLVSVLLFKEKLSTRQAVGLVGGILSLIGICLVP